MTELLKLVYDHSKSGKPLDRNLIDKIVESVVKEKGLDSYVRNIKFSEDLHGAGENDKKICVAAYRVNDKDIVIDPSVMQILSTKGDRYSELFGGFERTMYNNFMVTQIVLHELEHASQNKQADNKADSSDETKLIRASLVFPKMMQDPELLKAIESGKVSEDAVIAFIIYKRELYSRLYDLVPTERLAEINSYLTISNAVEPINKIFPSLYEFLFASAIHEMVAGYQDTLYQGSCPSLFYLQNNEQESIWKDLSFYDENPKVLVKKVNETYNLEKRLTLGLPVSIDEFEQTNNWLQTTIRCDG